MSQISEPSQLSPSTSPSSCPPADHHCDVLVVGGGVHGASVARDLAGRGWSVLLCEQDDLASHASSASGKLLHTGLRALASRDFGGVRTALRERELLLRSAPHIARPMRLVLPHDPAMRPAWSTRLCLWLHDQLDGSGFLPGSESIALRQDPRGEPLQAQWTQGFLCSGAWVDDARLVALCALDAADRGAQVLTRTRCEKARIEGAGWRVELSRRDALSGAETRRLSIHARVIVNAAGAWAERLLREVMAVPAGNPMLVKDSHIVVPRLFQHDHGYAFQGQGGRLVFALPFERDFTLVGATQAGFQGDPAQAGVDVDEATQLCRELSRYLRRPIGPGDVVRSFSGVRPRIADPRGADASGQAGAWLQSQARPAPWVTVAGGPLSGFRALSERAADQVCALLGEVRPAWTESACLPGGDLSELVDEPSHPVADMATFQHRLRQRHPWIDLALLRRWTQAHGSRVLRLLSGVSARGDLGAEIAPGLHEAELFFLKQDEWALTADDVLWRRSKLGLHHTPSQRQAVADWFAQQARRGGSGFHCSAFSRPEPRD